MSEALWGAIGAVVGGMLTGGAAIGAQVWATRSQANVAREAYVQQARVWHRDQRREPHHDLLNQINRLIHAAEAVAYPSPVGADAVSLERNFREAMALTVDAY